MQLQQLKEASVKLSPNDRLELVSTIVESLRETTVPQAKRISAIQRLRGSLKTNQPAPTDEAIATMLEKRRIEKYLQ